MYEIIGMISTKMSYHLWGIHKRMHIIIIIIIIYTKISPITVKLT